MADNRLVRNGIATVIPLWRIAHQIMIGLD
jgi:hypothetical protein